ncbi:hypothetical protein F5B19DRAFT_243633 [Rostrohypoxylon terebratum]|nr:hypothetical protein F5B19DRAFT_243633 [Rostrohypoxylon terebratum]
MDAFLKWCQVNTKIPRDKLDWDAILLGIDWTVHDFRKVLNLEVEAELPWEKLQYETLVYLRDRHNEWDAKHEILPKSIDDLEFHWSRAELEVDWRDDIELSAPSTFTNEQDLRDYVGQRYTNDDVVWQDQAPADEDWERTPEDVEEPFATVGFELELPIAVYRRTRKETIDPHPDETRWLADLSDKMGEPDREVVRKAVVDQLCAVLNEQTDSVFVPWDQSKATWEAYPEDDLEQQPTQPTQTVQTEPHALKLPHMKKRYETFSVYAMRDAHLDLSIIGRDRSTDYTDEPQGDYDPYHWEVIKISSPVFRLTEEHVSIALDNVCRVVRNNFCVHRDIPSFAVSTQLDISVSTGLDLLDLKKFVSLYTIMRQKGLYRLHREHRSKGAYEHVCGELKRTSRLWGLACMERRAVENAPDATYNTMPRPPDDERVQWMAQLEEHMPTDLIPALHGQGTLADRIYWAALWSFANVTRLARAMGTGLMSRKSEVMVKVAGDGARSNWVPREYSGPNGMERLYWHVTDTHRGVLEFRSCGGSLDPDHIIAWMYICYAIVWQSKFTDPAQFKDVVTAVLKGNEPMIQAVGAVDTENYYEGKVNKPSGFFEPPGSKVSWADPFYPPMKEDE